MGSDQDFYSKSGMMIFLISMVGTVGFFLYLVLVHPGVKGIDKVIEPVPVQPGAAPQAQVKSVDPDKVEKPWVSTPEMIAAGKKSYDMMCATCHGKTGQADGVAATPETRNLVKGDWKAGGTSIALFKTLQNGLEGTAMVSFKASVSKNSRWAIVHYIRSITENKPEDAAAELEAFAQTAD